MIVREWILMCLLFCTVHGYAQQQQNYAAAASKLYNAINANQYDKATGLYKELPGAESDPKPFAYLWPIACMYQTANEMETLNPSKKYMPQIWNTTEFYKDSRLPAMGYSSYLTGEKDANFAQPKIDSRYYDDNQWIGIAALDAYFRTNKKEYLTIGKRIYAYMMTGYDTVTTGGLYWKEDEKTTKNTCSNGPGIIVALQMYKATKQKPYLDTALMLYEWTNKTLQAPNKLYWDNINIKNGRIEKRWIFSYNTGTMLQSNMYLFELTGDKKYLTEAIAIADSSVGYFCNKKFRDDLWFEAVLLRGYQHLLKYHKDMKYVNAFRECADNVWQNNMNVNGLVGKKKPIGMVQQAGFAEILARLAEIDQMK